MTTPTSHACSCGLPIPPHICDQGRGCPLTEPTTEPGELADLREQRPPSGTGLARGVLALLLLAVGYVVGRVWP